MTTLNTLYLYNDVRHLLYSDSTTCFTGDSGPMNNRDLKAHKGLDNKLPFKVTGPDRKAVNLCGIGEIYARITNTHNHEVMLEKLCIKSTSCGMFILELNEGDIQHIPASTYAITLISKREFIQGNLEPGEFTAHPFFTDFNNNVTMAIEISEQAQRDPVPPVVILPNDWTPIQNLIPVNGSLVQGWYSKAIPGARVINHVNGVHTFSVQADNYTGTLEVLGTLDQSPDPSPDSPSWFKIFMSSMSDIIEFNEYTGTEAFTFKNNVMWIKFRYTPSTNVSNTGTIKKILVRN